jgi:hypothetical protein
MTSKEIDAEYEKAFLEKQKISIEKSRIDPKDKQAIAAKTVEERNLEQKCNWLLEDLNRKLIEERPAREMQELLSKLKTTGEGGIQIANALPDVGTYTGAMEHGKRHGQGIMIYNNKDTYEGEWNNDKMNGRGEFKKNVRDTRFDWEFYGDFKDNYPTRGRLEKNGETWQFPDMSGINIFDWIPNQINQRLEGGQVSAAGAADLRRRIEDHANERRGEAKSQLEKIMEARKKKRERQNLLDESGG